MVIPHGLSDPGRSGVDSERSNLIGFIGAGRFFPNRSAVDFIAGSVLAAPALGALECRVIGQIEGYSTGHSRLAYMGFQTDLADALEEVSVVCAPMAESGGVSTKVLGALACGKRTVCTPEAARGIARPPAGLWIAELGAFARATLVALETPWSEEDSLALRGAILRAHGSDAIAQAWEALISGRSETERQ